MTHRFFVDQQIQTDSVTLAGAEAHHLLHVMRGQVGDEVTVFDGSGCEFSARVETLSRSTVVLTVLQGQTVDRELPLTLTLGVALPKGERQKWLIEKAVEVGVTTVIPLKTTRSVAQPTGKVLDRLRRHVIEASKQCGRNRLMAIADPCDFAGWLCEKTADAAFILHPGGPSLASRCLAIRNPEAAWMSVGPEGGFTDAEITAAAAAGWDVVGLGKRILRIETAAITAAVLISACVSSSE